MSCLYLTEYNLCALLLPKSKTYEIKPQVQRLRTNCFARDTTQTTYPWCQITTYRT